MNRCAAAAVMAAVALAGAATAPSAQPVRRFPAQALRGELVVTQPPHALLDGRAAQLAPGARIRDPDNRLLLSGTLVGQRLPVHYTRDTLGLLLDVWVLTPAELARRPWPATPEEAARWTFDADAQTWSRP